jgi:hypothetical protein
VFLVSHRPPIGQWRWLIIKELVFLNVINWRGMLNVNRKSVVSKTVTAKNDFEYVGFFYTLLVLMTDVCFEALHLHKAFVNAQHLSNCN